ncbi:MAG TPA: OadG family protein [Bacillota bacterium]|nr:OadG family protein [Bacillota bacterium]
MDAQVMGQGFEVMIFGLAGVFAVLILFYITTKIMLKIAKSKPKKSE